jgi:hypothetical protein
MIFYNIFKDKYLNIKMTTRTYNLRSRKIDTTYIESSSNKVVKGRTSYYNNYEKIGIIESLTDKAYIRYGYNSVTLNVNEFLNTYNEFISNSEILIWRVNNIIEPINQDSLNHILSIIKETLLTKIKGNINDKLNDEININENYLVLNKLFYAMKDYVLLVIKYKADQKVKYFENENKIYSLIIKYIDKLYEKYKKNKQSEYDKQKIPLLYSTKLPNDISNYIIKEFL